MRDSVERFVANGGNVAFFRGNVCRWQVRVENNNRTMVCYRYRVADDPLAGTDNERVTVNWYAAPVDRPGNRMTGVDSRKTLQASFKAADPQKRGSALTFLSVVGPSLVAQGRKRSTKHSSQKAAELQYDPSLHTQMGRSAGKRHSGWLTVMWVFAADECFASTAVQRRWMNLEDNSRLVA
jgi:hypothetical protein